MKDVYKDKLSGLLKLNTFCVPGISRVEMRGNSITIYYLDAGESEKPDTYGNLLEAIKSYTNTLDSLDINPKEITIRMIRVVSQSNQPRVLH